MLCGFWRWGGLRWLGLVAAFGCSSGASSGDRRTLGSPEAEEVDGVELVVPPAPFEAGSLTLMGELQPDGTNDASGRPNYRLTQRVNVAWGDDYPKQFEVNVAQQASLSNSGAAIGGVELLEAVAAEPGIEVTLRENNRLAIELLISEPRLLKLQLLFRFELFGELALPDDANEKLMVAATLSLDVREPEATAIGLAYDGSEDKCALQMGLPTSVRFHLLGEGGSKFFPLNATDTRPNAVRLSAPPESVLMFSADSGQFSVQTPGPASVRFTTATGDFADVDVFAEESATSMELAVTEHNPKTSFPVVEDELLQLSAPEDTYFIPYVSRLFVGEPSQPFCMHAPIELRLEPEPGSVCALAQDLPERVGSGPALQASASGRCQFTAYADELDQGRGISRSFAFEVELPE